MKDPPTMQRREPYSGREPMERPSAMPEKAFGPVAAAFLAAGIGSLVLGILTTGAVISAGLSKALTISTRVGPLSGKTIWAVVAFVAAWAVLTVALWRRNPSQQLVYWLTGIGVGLGLLLTFPTFFDLFKG